MTETDIVERLRKAGLRDGFAVILYQHVQQAADEIERLRLAQADTRDDPEKIANASLHQRAALMAEIERLNKLVEELQKA
jgi:hypothetical protein